MNDDVTPQTRTDIRDGLRDMAPVMFAIVPFAALFGALAREAGFSVAAVMVTSASIYAGASQYVMLDLLGQKAPAWSIVLAVFVLNFRHVLYSAALGRHMNFGSLRRAVAFFFLVDPLYAAAEKRRREAGLRLAYYAASAASLWTVWMASNLVGAVFGGLIEYPARYGLDFILPLYFISMLVGFRDGTNFYPVVIVSAAVALLAMVTIGGTWPILAGGAAGLVLAAALAKPTEPVR